jgi:arabinan endo-1,5-alpha-L-arabinosidase
MTITRSSTLRVLTQSLAALCTAGALHAQTPTFTNVGVHDPSVVKEGANYYVFGSHMASASTPDLMHWTQISTTAAAPNSLIRNGTPRTEFAAALAYAETDTFWAPDVIKLGDGKFYFYYCACRGDSPLSVLGLAVADSITGPYADVGIMLRSGKADSNPAVGTYNATIHPNVVDPSVFFDKDGKLWMVYGSYSGGIFIMELNPATGQPLAGQGYGKRLIGGNHVRIEGAYIIYSPETSFYYLFLSYGGLAADGGYNIRVARSTSPDGPFLDSAGNDLTNVKGPDGTFFNDAAIAPYGVKLMGNWQFLHDASEPRTVSSGYVSPGHCSVHRDATTGKYTLVFHTRFVGRGEVHEVRAHQMYLNADGWFVAAPHRYAQETLAATTASQIPGSFKLINHGKDISATVKTSTIITLNAGGSISGAATGTWALAGNNQATIVLGGTSYRGVYSRQWDDDNRVWTLCFSALSTDGVSIWGTQIVPGNVAAQTVASGRSVNFSAPAGTTGVQWQIFASDDWQNLSNDSTYSGVATATLTITNATTTVNGAKYRYVGTAAGVGVTGTPVTLTVNPALFSAPTGVAVDSAGNLYVSDSTDNTIRKVATDGVTSVLAGTAGSLGSADGTGAAALFRAPAGLALDSAGSVYVADTGNSTVRKITAAGVVTTLAGSSGNTGSADGTGSAARFASPADLTITAAGTLYVADTGNHTVRQVDSAGAVTTRAGTAGINGTIDGTAAAARFNGPAGVAANATGELYVADTVNNTLRKVTTAGGVVTTLAGTYGITGSADGAGVNATFSGLTGTTTDSTGNVYVADTQNSTIRKITPLGVTTTLAGLPGVAGLQDGTGSDAWFNKPRDVAVDAAGNLYVADTGNAVLRKVTPAGVVTTIAVTAAATPPGGGTGGGGSPGGGTPPPASSGGGGGGGGGSPSLGFFAALVLLSALRGVRKVIGPRRDTVVQG